MQVTGQCHCGEIAFTAEIDPESGGLCHCTDCQRLTGTAFRTTFPVAEADFLLTRGAPRIYVKTADSGNPREQAFCPTCGTPIYATSVGPGPRTIGLRAGAIDGGLGFVPRRQVWTASAVSWLDRIGEMAAREGQ